MIKANKSRHIFFTYLTMLTLAMFFGPTVLLSPALFLCPSEAKAEELTLSPTKDTFLRRGALNTNEGANTRLSVRKSGRRAILLAFDLTPVALAGRQRPIVSAKIRLYVDYNSGNWGKDGRTISAYKLLTDWTEGNGRNAKRRNGENDNDEEAPVTSNRGTGEGATWVCPVDSNISNIKSNCAKSDRWNGGNFSRGASGAATITNQTYGFVEIDVTDSVQFFYAGTNINEGNFGWLIKRTQPAKPGSIWFNSREAALYPPQLVVSF
jgi:hypothetical protein